MDYEKTLNGIAVSVSEQEHKSSSLAMLLPCFLDSQDYAHIVSLRKLLAENGFTAVSFDAPGIWKSSSADISKYSLTNYLKGVEQLIAYFESGQAVEKIILIGHSMGGKAAILAA